MAAEEAPPEALLKPALRLLSTRARSVEELRGRLEKKGFGSSEVSRCLRWLADRELLDDEAFSRSLIRDRLSFSPRSPYLLEKELAGRGVSPSLAEKAVESVLEEEEISPGDLSVRAAESWVRKQSPSTRAELSGDRFSSERERTRQRLYRFLTRRGFRGELARQGLEAGLEKARKLEAEARNPGN